MVVMRVTVSKAFGLAYALTAFAGTFAFFTAFIFFLGNLPKRSAPLLEPTVDIGPATDWPIAVVSNLLLLSLFCLQHSLMARPFFKRLLEHYLPRELERATYVLMANAAGFLIILFWSPLPALLWSVEGEEAKAVLWTGFALGWLLLFSAAFSMNVFELLGLRQAWAWFRGLPDRPLQLKTAGPYRYLEHPMYVGVILGMWMAPVMTAGHAMLAATLTLYIGVAMAYERRDLIAKFGTTYRQWRGEPILETRSEADLAFIRTPLPSSIAHALERLRLAELGRGGPLEARLPK